MTGAGASAGASAGAVSNSRVSAGPTHPASSLVPGAVGAAPPPEASAPASSLATGAYMPGTYRPDVVLVHSASSSA